MKIAYDITQAGTDKAGCGYFAYSLIRALARIDSANEYSLLSSFGGHTWNGKAPLESCGIRRPNFKSGLMHTDMATAQRFWSTPPSDLDAALGNPDIVHANNFFCPRGLRRARLVYTLYDLSFIKHPEWTTEANRIACFDGVYNASIYADAILAISEYSRNHFLSIFPHYPPEKIRVVYPASRYENKIQIKRPFALPDNVKTGQFWLSVGTLEPRKNHIGLLRAYAQYKTKVGRAFPLVHAGASGWLMDNFKDEILRLGLQENVVLLGYVNEVVLQWLYQNCFAFVYPSFFEGFGLPVLEAMSLGSAVIASDTSSIPEIVGEAGVLINPNIEKQIADAMEKLFVDSGYRVALKNSAVQQANKFSWDRTAQKVLEVYQSMMDTGVSSLCRDKEGI